MKDLCTGHWREYNHTTYMYTRLVSHDVGGGVHYHSRQTCKYTNQQGNQRWQIPGSATCQCLATFIPLKYNNMLSPSSYYMALYISYFMSKNSTLVLVLMVSYSTINKVFIFIFNILIFFRDVISLLARVFILWIDRAIQEVPMTNIWNKLSVQFVRYTPLNC